ncbi:MAG TPA: TetR/AcrR family transcriptional regulator [Jiangellaceae bacterium]|nr:TetR/AcrR family transcriptional regulator [Jiangellaceae bacterium]
MLNDQLLTGQDPAHSDDVHFDARARQATQRRAQISRAGLSEFLERGYYGASTRSIAQRVGVSSGLIFKYFPSKLALYEELVTFALRHLEWDWDSGLSDPIGFLRAQIRELLTLLDTQPVAGEVFQLVAYAEAHPGISATVDDALATRSIEARTVPLIIEGQQRGEVRTGDAQALATALWAAVQGLAEAVSTRAGIPLPEADWLLDIIRHPGRTR